MKYVEESFGSSGKNKILMPLHWDEYKLDKSKKTFLSALANHLSHYIGFTPSIADYDYGGLLFPEQGLESVDISALERGLMSFNGNVIVPYKRGGCIIANVDGVVRCFTIQIDDLSSQDEAIFMLGTKPYYQDERALMFIKENKSGKMVTFGHNYIKIPNYPSLLKAAEAAFGALNPTVYKNGSETVLLFSQPIYESASDKRKKGSKIFFEASLSDSDTFQQINKSSSVMTRIRDVIKTGAVLDKEFIEEQYMLIQRTHISPLSEKILRAFDDGRIKLIFNETQHLTQAIPFVVLNMGGKPSACIFISDYSAMNKDKTLLTIEMKQLYVLMEAAYVGLHFFTNPAIFTNSGRLSKIIAKIYAEMGVQILNREYALSLQKDVYDTVNYILGRFCLSKLLGLSNPELQNAYAISCCNAPTQLSMDMAKAMYEKEEIKSINDVINLIRTAYPKMANLTYRYYFERWIMSFGVGSTLAIDSFPYFYFVLVNVMLGCFMVKSTSISDIVKKTPGINQFYGELVRMC